MKMRVQDARMAYLSNLAPGTLVRPGSSAYTGRFRAAMVVGLVTGHSEKWRGLLALDGSHAGTIFAPDSPVAVRVLPHTDLFVVGIDELEQGATSTSHGSLTIRSEGGPVLRASIYQGQSGYVDLSNGQFVKLGSEELQESFLSWTLVAVDANTKSEEVIAVGPGTPSL